MHLGKADKAPADIPKRCEPLLHIHEYVAVVLVLPGGMYGETALRPSTCLTTGYSGTMKSVMYANKNHVVIQVSLSYYYLNTKMSGYHLVHAHKLPTTV